jgi:hypothetical protein
MDVVQFLVTILMVLLVAVLIRRRMWKLYPFFCAYIFFSIADSVALFSVRNHYLAYFQVYWSAQVVYSVLGMLALYDVFRHIFRPFCELFKLFWIIFPTTIVTILMASIFFTILRPPTQAAGVIRVVLSFAVIDTYIQLGLFCMFFVLMILLGIHWCSYAFGIIEGFAASALGSLLGFGVRYVLGVNYNTLGRLAPPLGFLFAVVLWLNAFLRPPDPVVDRFEKASVTAEQLSIRIRTRKGPLMSFFWKHNF